MLLALPADLLHRVVWRRCDITDVLATRRAARALAAAVHAWLSHRCRKCSWHWWQGDSAVAPLISSLLPQLDLPPLRRLAALRACARCSLRGVRPQARGGVLLAPTRACVAVVVHTPRWTAWCQGDDLGFGVAEFEHPNVPADGTDGGGVAPPSTLAQRPRSPSSWPPADINRRFGPPGWMPTVGARDG